MSEKTEAIVISVSGTLDLGGGAARAVAKAVGSRINEQCMDLLQGRGGRAFDYTDVVHVDAGNLEQTNGIRYIVMAIGPAKYHYDHDDAMMQAALVDTFFNCLQYADSILKIGSISIPAISAGKPSYSMFPDLVLFRMKKSKSKRKRS